MTETVEQMFFDKAVAHARKQKCASMDNDSCYYRGPNGTKCFVGALIKDEFYNPGLENNAARDELVIAAVRKSFGLSKLTLDEENLLERLQTVHDDALVENWEQAFYEIAEDYGLTYTPTTAYKILKFFNIDCKE